jgi:hypothetical protein
MIGENSFWDALTNLTPGRSLYFDREGRPITLQRWTELHEHSLDADDQCVVNPYLRVAEDLLDDGAGGSVWVSTVWLGIDHGFGMEPVPVIFETMIFGGEHDHVMMRYSTEAEAIKGHREAVDDLRAGLAPWWSYGGCEDDEWRSRQ